jgi:serine/threonine protein kinase
MAVMTEVYPGRGTAPDGVGPEPNPAPRPAAARRGTRFQFACGDRPLAGYEIKRGIGAGGFGEVYFALSESGKEVALKWIDRHTDTELRGVRHCLNVRHANLVTIFDIRQDDHGQPWVVMEYVPGENLRAVLDRHPHGMPAAAMLRWLEGICGGVGCLHEHGIVHRDLKPANVFDDGELVKVGDYGLSKFLAPSHRSGQTESVGTCHYMAPEIGRGRYGKEIDVYAVGVLLYEMATGRVPFDGETSQEVLMRHLTDLPRLESVPSALRPVLAKALAKSPEDRFRSLDDLYRAAQAALAPLPCSADATLDEAEERIATLVAEDRPHGDPARRVPPIRVSGTEDSRADDTLYIRDDAEEMVFGPLHDSGGPPPEPIAAWCSEKWRAAQGWWNGRNWPLSAQALAAILIVAALIGGAAHAWWMIPVAILAGLLYLTYAGIRWFLLILFPAPAGAGTSAALDSVAQVEQRCRETLAERSWPAQFTELSGSWLAAALVAGALAIVGTSLAGETATRSLVSFGGHFLWLGVVIAAGSALLLALGKRWEGDAASDAWVRRILLLVAGLAVGAVAWGVGDFLLVGPSYDLALQAATSGYLDLAYQANGLPTLAGHLVYFGLLFAAIGWWHDVDPLRQHRFSLWSVVWATAVAGALHLLWPFPQPWGLLIAAGLSISVQLASPWWNAEDRFAAFASRQ